MASLRAAILALAMTLGAACVEDVGFVPEDGKLALRVRLDEGDVQIDRIPSRAQRAAPASRTGPAIGYELADEAGRVVVAGQVDDPRIQRFEVSDADGFHAQELFGKFGSFELLLPGLSGELRIYEETRDGRRELGSAAVDPAAPASHTSALLSDRDVGTLRTLIDHGDAASSVDLLFLPDGYTAGEEDDFEDSVRAVAAQLERDPDYGPHWDRINILVQDVTSTESGAEELGGRQVDTAFDMVLERLPGRDVYLPTFGSAQAREAADRLGREAQADKVVIVINSSLNCGSGGATVNLCGGRAPDATLAHELAHSLFGLSDEYEVVDGECGERGGRQPGPNISMTSDRSRLPWRDLIERATPLPTPDRVDEVGAFEGGWYCDEAFRPQHDCMMRTLGTPMCEVCRRELETYFDRLGPGGGARGGADSRDDAERNGGGDRNDGGGDRNADGDQRGGGGEDRAGAGWSCEQDYFGTDDGCDCGCGAVDPDCQGRGCTGRGCFEQGCEFCHGDGASLACNRVAGDENGGDVEDGNVEGGGNGARSCEDYDWSVFCVDGDDFCDEGDGCCTDDLDDRDGGPCQGEGEADLSADCPADYDWVTFCVDDDDLCDEGDGCCLSDDDCDSESEQESQDDCYDYDFDTYCVDGDQYCDQGDAGGCCGYDSDCGNAEDLDVDDGDSCDDDYWNVYCVDGDGYCDEGDGCCGLDSDCGASEDEGQDDTGDACADYDWNQFCVDGDGFCDQGDGCCSYDSDNETDSCRT